MSETMSMNITVWIGLRGHCFAQAIHSAPLHVVVAASANNLGVSGASFYV
jgi:hypothetical protein